MGPYSHLVMTRTISWCADWMSSPLNICSKLVCNYNAYTIIRIINLRVPERIEYKVAVLTYKVLNGSAPRYLGPLVPVADLPGRRTLRSAGTNRLLVPPRLSTVGNRAFTVAGPRVWNTLLEDITTSQSLSAFCQHLKTWLFRKSYPDIII